MHALPKILRRPLKNMLACNKLTKVRTNLIGLFIIHWFHLMNLMHYKDSYLEHMLMEILHPISYEYICKITLQTGTKPKNC